MAGSRNAGDDRRDGGAGNDSSFKDRVILALMAVILGGGGAAGYLNANPPRPDPFTGTDAKELETRLLKRIELMESKDEALRARVEAHLIRGEGGFYRIEQLERELREIKQLLNHKH